MSYRWDFPIKNKNMDKPTSEKDVIKSLPGSSPTERMLLKVKPVFDKMLAALKIVDDPNYMGVSFMSKQSMVRAAIKEAEELGL